jgi:hypothetical protein
MILIQFIVYSILVTLLLGPFIGYAVVNYLNTNFLYLVSMLVILGFFAQLFLLVLEGKKIHLSKFSKYYLLFVLYTFLSDIFIVGQSIGFKEVYSNKYIASALILVMIENTKFSKNFIKGILKLILAIVIISVIVIIMQQVIDPYIFAKPSFFESWENVGFTERRLPSIFSWVSNITAGFSFVSLVTLLIDHYFYNNNKKMIFSSYVLGTIFSFLIKARWVLLNFLIVAVAFILKRKKVKKIKLVFISGISAILILTTSYFVLSELKVPVVEIVQDRILEVSSGGIGTGSSYSRIISAFVFIELFPENPILGKGKFHTFDDRSGDPGLQRMLGGTSSQIHIGYLSLFYYYGLVGGTLYLLFLFYLMKDMKRIAKLTNHWGPFYVFIGFIVANITLVYLSFYDAGLIMGLVFHIYYRQTSKNSYLQKSKERLAAS